MILVKNNKLKYSFIITILTILFISGCGTAYIASKQDDLLTQIDVWAAENKFGKALSTLDYVKKSHPQYQQLQARKKSLLVEADEYEQRIDKQVHAYILDHQWEKALDLLDQAKKNYPLDKSDNKHRGLVRTEKKLLEQQLMLLADIDQKIMLKRTRWMIETRPLYKNKLKTDPRNEILKKKVKRLNNEAVTLAKKLTELAKKAVKNKHYKTARIRITQALALEPIAQREKLLVQIKKHSRKIYLSKKKKKKTHQQKLKKEQYNSLLQEIERTYSAGNFLGTRQLILQLNENDKKDIQLIQLKQELDRSINYTTKQLMSEANKNYTDGHFYHAIDLWEQVLLYEPENILAKKNIQRAEKVIDKLILLKEKQRN